MTYDELIKKIERRKRYYSKNIKNGKLGFYIDFLENYPNNDMTTWINIKTSDMLKLWFYMKGVDMKLSPEECSLIDDLSSENIIDLTHLIGSKPTNDKEVLEKIYINYTINNNPNVKHRIDPLTGNIVIECPLEHDEQEFQKFVKLYEKMLEHINVAFFARFVTLKDEYRKLCESLYNASRRTKMVVRDKNSDEVIIVNSEKDIRKLLSSSSKYPGMEKTFGKIYAYLRKRVGNLNNRKINRYITSYQNLLDILKDENKKEEITNINKIVDNACEEEILVACLEYVYEHNKIYYEKLEAEYLDKSANSVMKFMQYFKTIGINFDTLNDELKSKIMEESLENVKKKMSIIMKLSEADSYINILINNNLSDLEKLMDYTKKQYISVSFIKENSNILTNRNDYNNFVENMEILLSKKVNIKKYESNNFLLANHNTLVDNIVFLESIGVSFAKANDLSFLGLSLKDKIEKFVEVGLEDIIFENPDILNCDDELAERIIITKMVGEEPIEGNTIKDFVLNKDKFFVSQNAISNYLLDRNNREYQNKEAIFISDTNSTALSYNVDGIIIPKTRVRESATLESIISPSLYSKEEVKILERSTKK